MWLSRWYCWDEWQKKYPPSPCSKMCVLLWLCKDKAPWWAWCVPGLTRVWWSLSDRSKAEMDLKELSESVQQQSTPVPLISPKRQIRSRFQLNLDKTIESCKAQLGISLVLFFFFPAVSLLSLLVGILPWWNQGWILAAFSSCFNFERFAQLKYISTHGKRLQTW